MRNNIFIIGCFLFVFQGFSQEPKLGVTAGYLNLNVSTSFTNSEYPEFASGFYAGILGDFAFSEALHIEPSAIYGFTREINMLYIPVFLKYYIADSGISVLAGPQGSIILDEISPLVKRLGWDVGVGVGYDINDNIFFRVRYAMEITNRYNETIIGAIRGNESGFNSLFAGVGYKF